MASKAAIFSTRSGDLIEKTVRQVLGSGDLKHSPERRAQSLPPMGGMPFVNLSGESIPPFGIVWLDAAIGYEGSPILRAKQPGAVCGYFGVNDGQSCGVGETGLTQAGPLVRLRTQVDPSAFVHGDLIGPDNGAFHGVRYRPGFHFLSLYDPNDKRTVLAYQPSHTVFLAKSHATVVHESHTSQLVSLLQADGETLTSPLETLTAYNPSGVAIPVNTLLNVEAWPERGEYRIREAFICTD